MKLFQNYISHIPTKVYETLLGEHIIDGLKFPGTGASLEDNLCFIELAWHLGCLVDNHGWNGITGQLHDPHFADHIAGFSCLQEYLKLPNALNFSSHIGAKVDSLPFREIPLREFDYFLLKNLSAIRKWFVKSTGKEPVIYGEGLFPYYFDPRTTTPDFINRTLKSSDLDDGLDGLVLDICHSTIAARYMERNVFKKPYSFFDYVSDLDTTQIKIIHISGNPNLENLLNAEDVDFWADNSLDPHLPNSLQGLLTLRQLLKICPNVEQVSNEIAYSKVFGNPVSLFDYCLEAISMWCAINGSNNFCNVISLVSNELDKDCTNLYDVIKSCKSSL